MVNKSKPKPTKTTATNTLFVAVVSTATSPVKSPVVEVVSTATSPVKSPVMKNDAQTQTLKIDDSRLICGVRSLRSAIDDEISAVRKHSHILNLSNAGNLRSLQVRVAGLEARLKASGRIKDVLEFHAVSAESKLAMYEKETSGKIKAGRENRTRMEREKLAGELEGLEQRSREAGGIMGGMMIARLPDVKIKVEECKGRRERVVKDIVEGMGEKLEGDRVEVRDGDGVVKALYV